jgi:hypothetical protein
LFTLKSSLSQHWPRLLPALLIWFSGKLNGEVIRLNVNAGDMGGDEVLVAGSISVAGTRLSVAALSPCP